MAFVSITRLRIRSLRFMPQFIALTWRSLRQAQTADGFRGGSLLGDRRLTYWTMTSWDSQAHMRAYMTTGSHRIAMPRLLDWCDEASVVHWDGAGEAMPTWQEAAERMRGGRASKVRHPSPNHAGLSFARPRLGGTLPIRAKRAA